MTWEYKNFCAKTICYIIEICAQEIRHFSVKNGAIHIKVSCHATLSQNLESVIHTPGPFCGGWPWNQNILFLSLWRLSKKASKMSLSRSRGSNSVLNSPAPRRANSPAATSTPKVRNIENCAKMSWSDRHHRLILPFSSCL